MKESSHRPAVGQQIESHPEVTPASQLPTRTKGMPTSNQTHSHCQPWRVAACSGQRATSRIVGVAALTGAAEPPHARHLQAPRSSLVVLRPGEGRATPSRQTRTRRRSGSRTSIEVRDLQPRGSTPIHRYSSAIRPGTGVRDTWWDPPNRPGACRGCHGWCSDPHQGRRTLRWRWRALLKRPQRRPRSPVWPRRFAWSCASVVLLF